MARQTIYMEYLVGSKEAGRGSPLHECDWKVAANAISGQHDPRMRRVNGQSLFPRIGAPQRAVVPDQPFVGDNRCCSQLRIDMMKLR
jgi:hypothetical protein